MLKAGMEKADIERYHKSVVDTYVEEWEPALQRENLTFRTDYVAIDGAASDFLMGAYREFEAMPEESRYDAPEGGRNAFDDWFEVKMATPVGMSLVGELQAAMDSCMDRFGCSKVFVKGSSRSAKDAVIFTRELKRDLGGRLDCLQGDTKENSRDVPDTNAAIIAMLGAGKDAMASSSARYFLRLFVRSERINQDLRLARENRFPCGFAIREWVDIDIGMEFRGFVHAHELTACCQYDYLVLVSRLLDPIARDKLSDDVRSFWRTKVHPVLKISGPEKFASYVVDFAVDVTGRLWVIELNPFEESTDGALFSWVQDRPVLERGPYEFRVQHRLQNAPVCLSREWRETLNTMMRARAPVK